MPVQLDVPDVDRVAAVAQQLGDVQLVLNNAGHRALRDVAEREAGRGPRRAVDKIAPAAVALAALDSVRGR